ncbi:PIG-L deacetylase family protein [Nocardioides acrostichi]|uniref:PIG-L family deacetylase n=1 Tax=Nocardioides acrostichi TaxID=2784339 RepID=A0A930UZH6_9ACTN|nr:PIG-L family deacetylase [Nocardioides acrostichi]MBF4163753.1 PIG-L family deacetylase [Nocardioides acrostichi]
MSADQTPDASMGQTVVFVHAHPDDEGTGTAGTMVRLAREGHRVVVVYATNGDFGAAPEDLAPGETLVARRRSEAEASAAITGLARVAWLDYADSGMTGWEQNSGERAFSRAEVDEAARRLADVLDQEGADVVVGYDWHGGYGHPDHVMVHTVSKRAIDMAATQPRYLEVTMNRDKMRELFKAAQEMGMEGFDPDARGDDGLPIGTPEAEIHWAVDVTPDIAAKRAALACHGSQTDVQQILSMPEDVFSIAFGTEHYVEPGRPEGMVTGWWMDPVPAG